MPILSTMQKPYTPPMHTMLPSARSFPVLVATLLVLLVLPLGHAQLSIELTPPNARYRAQPGDQISGTLTVRNPGSTAVGLSVFPSDFVLMPNGAIRPLPAGSLPTSLTSWLTVNATHADVEGKGSQDITYSVHVPNGVKPGTYWAAILLQTDTPRSQQSNSDTSVGVQYVGQLAYVIFVDVGAMAPAGKITDIAVKAKDSSGGNSPVAHVAFQNTGNAYMILNGRLELRTLNGTLVGKYDLPQGVSLPNELTELVVQLPDSLKGGDYLATAILNYGTPKLIAGQNRVTLP